MFYATNHFRASALPPSTVQEFYTTNVGGQTTSATVQPPGASPWAAYQYQYDADGQLVKITNTATSPATTETFQYDAVGQLTHETLFNGTTIADTYDRLGNRLTQTVTPAGGTATTTTYGYDTEHNQLTSINGGAVTSDANGNITQAGTNTYTLTDANQLASDGTPNGTLAITYDGLGRPSQFTTPRWPSRAMALRRHFGPFRLSHRWPK